jgi:hypothetical protein
MSNLCRSLCQYGRKEEIKFNFNSKKDKYEKFICPIYSELGSDFCCFHDVDRSKFTSEYLNGKFKKIR